jgi:hypothetical protein
MANYMKKILLFHHKSKLILAAVLFLASTVFPVFAPTNQVEASLSGSAFKAGRIIDDEIFYNSSSMSVNQIQNFLNSKVPVCDTNGQVMYNSTQTRAQWAQANGRPLPPYICLKGFSQNVPTVTNSGSNLCKGSIAGGTKSAAQIIHDVGKACGINPQVLLVMLQKEMSLVTDTWPWPRQYEIAMGYGCPDSGPNYSANCSSTYYGFFNQVYQAAQAYRRYEANPTWYNYRPNRNNYIQYHPNPACGGTNVFIENQATANLYIYTPYQPNSAALSNLYGTGNDCSAYGNRNFWRLFNDWFGSTWRNEKNVIYRLYNRNTNNHLYTSSARERDKAIKEANFKLEGEAFKSCDTTGKDLYRLYNPVTGRHLFTTSVSERDKANKQTNFSYEGVAFRVCGSKTVYRLYSAREQKHFYTTSVSERDKLVRNTSFVYEGVAFTVN